MMPYNIPIPTLECGMETGGPRGKKGRVPVLPGIGTLSPSPMTRALIADEPRFGHSNLERLALPNMVLKIGSDRTDQSRFRSNPIN